MLVCIYIFFFQAEDGIRDLVRSRGLGDVYKRQIVFTNGELDPWRAGGIVPTSAGKYLATPGTTALIVTNAGHHMDLMFSAPEDSLTNVIQVRAIELEHITRWINEHHAGTN
eukprot:TRINITY_DN21093_c0_g1_i1.p1 TRINITY_DN21093_c0_g1~~TRINITY_DN21093_c0_g1_i1.p1  ORF type:complete len:112 (-),score=17.63 TRINITY_DN21093_c0_g1_i1:105-440(-)